MIPPIDEDVIAAVVKHLAAMTGREPSELLDELRRSRESGAEAINSLFGVTRMPETLNWFDIQDVSRYLPADFVLDSDYVHVKFDVDIDETGNVTASRLRPRFPFHKRSTASWWRSTGMMSVSGQRAGESLPLCRLPWWPRLTQCGSDQQSATVGQFPFAGCDLALGTRGMISHAKQPPNMRLKLAGALVLKEAVVSCPGARDVVHFSCAGGSVARSLSAIR